MTRETPRVRLSRGTAGVERQYELKTQNYRWVITAQQDDERRIHKISATLDIDTEISSDVLKATFAADGLENAVRSLDSKAKFTFRAGDRKVDASIEFSRSQPFFPLVENVFSACGELKELSKGPNPPSIVA